jgi:Ohr subfamily peroxiredoxin
MTQGLTVLYTAKIRTTAVHHNGISRSLDGVLDIRLSIPGSAGIGANPEQLIASGWSSSLVRTITLVAVKNGVALPTGVSIDAEIDLCIANEIQFLRARFNFSLLGLERSIGLTLANEAFEFCPYSKAVRGNIDVAITLTREAH